MKPTITALFLVKDEIEFLPLSVASVIDDVDEVVIVDNESTDGTGEVARELAWKYPSKVKVIEMDGDFDKNCEYVNRNKALKYVTSSWVMVLDADQVMSDDWYRWVRKSLLNPKIDAIRVFYEHLVGSYEYIHKSFYEKQKNNSLHPDVPLWQTVLFRMRPDLECIPASRVNSFFKDFHHASFDNSMVNRQFFNCGSATVFHYGFAKKDMMKMSIYRIQRGDYGHDQDVKDRKIKELKESNNPFLFVGNVVRVGYGPERVPSIMRKKFGKTYKLELDRHGFIQSRTLIETGERL